VPDRDEASASLPPPGQVSLLELFLVCFRLGIFSFGGGLTGWIYQEVVVKRRWMEEQDFLSGLALAQVLPGINITNLLVYVGQRLRGAAGAFVAVGSLLLGPFFIVIGLVLVYQQIAGLTWLQAVMDGVAAAALGLLLFVGLKATQRFVRRPEAMFILIATIVAVGILQWPLIPVALVLGPISVALAWRSAPGGP
jgi:chromate transporter